MVRMRIIEGGRENMALVILEYSRRGRGQMLGNDEGYLEIFSVTVDTSPMTADNGDVC